MLRCNTFGKSVFFSGFIKPHTPVAQKVADEVTFRRFQGEGVEIF